MYRGPASQTLATALLVAAMSTTSLAQPAVTRAPATAAPDRATTFNAAPPERRLASPKLVDLRLQPAQWLRVGTLSATLAGAASIDPATVVSASIHLISPGCQFVQLGPVRVSARDGLTTLHAPGYLRPAPIRTVEASGCSGDVRAQITGPGSLRTGIEPTAWTLAVDPHERVVVQNTARLRGWLKPHYQRPGCETDDGDGNLGVRVTASPVGGDCRVDFMDAGNRDRRTDENFNMLSEAATLLHVTWRLDGDRTQCELCEVVGAPCRGANRVGPVGPLYYPETLYGYQIRPGRSPFPLGVISAPPLREGPQVLATEYIIIGYNRTNDWRHFLTPMYARISCAPWAPPPAQAARGVAGAFSGQAVAPPTAPRMRLVLEEMVFLRPRGTRLPFD